MIHSNLSNICNDQHISILPIKEKMALTIHNKVINIHNTLVLNSVDCYKAIYNETIDYI